VSNEHTYGPSALLTPANLMTAFRLVAAPFFIYLIIFDRISWWTVAVGLAVGASDYFDGIVARRHGTTTSGAFLDPLADKVVVLGALYAMIISRPHGLTFFIVRARPSTGSRSPRVAWRSGRPSSKTGRLAFACCPSPGITRSSPS